MLAVIITIRTVAGRSSMLRYSTQEGEPVLKRSVLEWSCRELLLHVFGREGNTAYYGVERNNNTGSLLADCRECVLTRRYVDLRNATTPPPCRRSPASLCLDERVEKRRRPQAIALCAWYTESLHVVFLKIWKNSYRISTKEPPRQS